MDITRGLGSNVTNDFTVAGHATPTPNCEPHAASERPPTNPNSTYDPIRAYTESDDD